MNVFAEASPLLIGFIYLILCGFCQYAWDRVPNWLTLVALLGGLVASVLVQTGQVPGSGDLASSILNGALGFILLIGFYAYGILGAGCVKSQAVFGVWLGCIYAFDTSAFLMLLSTCAAIAVTAAAAWIWEKLDKARLFPAQVTISLVTIAATLVGLLTTA